MLNFGFHCRRCQMSEWISIEELQPKDKYKHHEPGPNVLVFTIWGMKIGRQWGCGKWTDDHIYDIEGVTHWMPLPPLPNE